MLSGNFINVSPQAYGGIVLMKVGSILCCSENAWYNNDNK